jgi:putative DNA primase/helicase
VIQDIDIDHIPPPMRALRQWVLWRYEQRGENKKPTKPPFQLDGKYARSNDPASWCSFDEAAAADGFSGIGFCFAKGDGLVGIDLDHCFSADGELEDWAAEIVELFSASYVEYSPSGDGLHIICRGRAITTGHRKWKLDTPAGPGTGIEVGFEIYDHTSPRYLTVTGDIVRPNDPAECQPQLERLYELYWGDDEDSNAPDAPAVSNLRHMPVAPGTVESALQFINADNYETWFKIGMALKYNGYPLELWDAWSATSSKYEAGACAAKWESFKPSPDRKKPVGLGTIFHMARQGGMTASPVRLQTIGQVVGGEAGTTGGAVAPAQPADVPSNELHVTPELPDGNPSEHPQWSGRFVPHAYRLTPAGVLKLSSEKPSGEKICGPIFPIAETAAPAGGNAGLVLEVESRDKIIFTLPIPRERLHEDAPLLARDLAHFNFSIIPGKEKELLKYLEACGSRDRRTAVTQTGWAASKDPDRMVYVLPNTATEPGYHFQPERYNPSSASVTVAGTVQQWVDNVFDPSPYSLFVVCLAAAAPLLKASQSDSFGFHFHGSSSCGKTTLAQIAASFWGCGADPADAPEYSYIRRWNATQNALEGLCAAHNDMLVAFDEIGSHSSRDFGKAIYDITGGQGKSAMDASRNLKRQRSWRNLFLSTGEVSVRCKIEESMTGKRATAKAGQLLRLIDISVNQSVFSGRLQVDKIKRSCSQYYGSIGMAYIQAIVDRFATTRFKDNIQYTYDAAVERLINGRAELTSIQQRAAKRFALVETAGILLVELGLIHGLVIEDVRKSVDTVFGNWLPSSVELNDTDRAIIALREFILANRDTRFKKLTADASSEKLNRELAGYYDPDKDAYYLLPAGVREATGIEPPVVARALREKSLILLNRGDKHLTSRITAENKRVTVYAVKAELLGSDEAE